MTYQILLDLLYENKQYQDVLDTVYLIAERQVEGHTYPKNVIVLAMAACYKMVYLVLLNTLFIYLFQYYKI